jgi:hypothetical protein
MKVTTDEVRRAAMALLTHLDETGQSEVEIEEDFYWHIPEQERYDTYAKPKEFTVGQLSDDWAEIQAILAGRRKPVGMAMVWLASVMRRMGEKSRG